ncbi:hypothetical protein SGFS_063660 [Streptomyces graminofaciens]|uniref:Secreted protein n=1 Tax=Streptomyces graminofaciens TaxID=68212 RepID=A0ABM7FFW0_9ACTN|nr:hypothetical protein [Streptomyces graminofaciens]BBC35072.1 hypothetical protein SGFS_063660 [Streptomyces graminofaciens]
MITAWSPSGAQRSRSTAVLWRMVGLGLFLFGLLYTHAVSPDATVRHVSSDEGVAVSDVHFTPAVDREKVASATSAMLSGETPHDPSGDRHEGHGQHHAGGECSLGQPPQAPGVGVPCLSPLSSASDGDDGLSQLVRAHYTAAQDVVAPVEHAADSAVLRI